MTPSLLPQVPTGRELDQLSRFAASLGTTLDVDVLVQEAVEPIRTLSRSDSVLIAIAQTDARLLIPETVGWQMDPACRGIPAPVIAALGTEAVSFDHMDEVPSSIASRIEQKDGCMAIVPLWAHAHLRGVMVLQRKSEPFTPHLLKILTTAGRQFALAVENSRLLSDLQESYRKLMDTQEELIRAERLAALGQLSATMAHEIRNPLATIFSAISQIRKNPGKEQMVLTLLGIAEEEANRLNGMVTELLKFARPRKPLMQDGNLMETVSRIVNCLQERSGIPDNIRLSVSGTSADIRLLHDEDLIEQALLQLISNSVDAIEGETGDIVITVSPKYPGAVIEIRDSGCGIPSELQARILEPFFSTKSMGHGLGLPTVKRIAEDHRGSLEIRTAAGTKTNVRLFLHTKQRSAV